VKQTNLKSLQKNFTESMRKFTTRTVTFIAVLAVKIIL